MPEPIAFLHYIDPPACPECEIDGVTPAPTARVYAPTARVYIQLPDQLGRCPLGPPRCRKHAQLLADHVNRSGHQPCEHCTLAPEDDR